MTTPLEPSKPRRARLMTLAVAALPFLALPFLQAHASPPSGQTGDGPKVEPTAAGTDTPGAKDAGTGTTGDGHGTAAALGAPPSGDPNTPPVEPAHGAPAGAGHGTGHGAGHAAGHEGVVAVVPPAHPTDIGVGIYLVGLTEVDPPSESFPKFTGEFFLELEWHDPRTATLVPADAEGGKEVFLEHEAELMLERIWWPDIVFENEEGHRQVQNRELIITADGHVDYRERFSGVFRSTPDLRKFPFDHQDFTVQLESFAWDEKDLKFHVLEKDIGFAGENASLEWEITGVSGEVSSKQEVRSPESFSKFEFHIHATRDSGYYMLKVVVPLIMIVVLSWAIFWMPGEPASVRLERGFVGLLTVVAFHQIVSQYLPRIGYMTFMDAVVYLAFGSVGLTMFTTMYAQRLEYTGRADRVIQIDRVCQILFPVTFFSALVVLWFVYHA